MRIIHLINDTNKLLRRSGFAPLRYEEEKMFIAAYSEDCPPKDIALQIARIRLDILNSLASLSA